MHGLQAEKASQCGDLGSLQGRLDARDAQLQDATRQLNVLKFMLSNMNTEDTSGQVSMQTCLFRQCPYAGRDPFQQCSRTMYTIGAKS